MDGEEDVSAEAKRSDEFVGAGADGDEVLLQINLDRVARREVGGSSNIFNTKYAPEDDSDEASEEEDDEDDKEAAGYEGESADTSFSTRFAPHFTHHQHCLLVAVAFLS